jgi:hypothetical protein
MTMITDTKNLLADCQKIEDTILDTVSFHSCPEDIVTIKYQIEQVPKKAEECREMIHSLSANYSDTRIYQHRDHLRRMSLRLEAAVMYAKKEFGLE